MRCVSWSVKYDLLSYHGFIIVPVDKYVDEVNEEYNKMGMMVG